MHSTFLSSTPLFLCVPPGTKRNLLPLKHHYFQESEVQSWVLPFKLIKVIQEKCVRKRHVTSESLQIRVLVCSPWDVLLTPFSLQNIYSIFLQNKTFMILPHICSSGKKHSESSFSSGKSFSLSSYWTSQIHEWNNSKVKKCFHSLTNSLKRSVEDSKYSS